MWENASLTNLNVLGNVTSIGGAVNFWGNASVTSLNGLDNIDYTTISSLYLQNSSNLSSCEVKSICDYLDNGGPATISGNATGCNSVDEVQAACEAVPATEMDEEKDRIEMHPNPTTGMVEITSGKSGQIIKILKVTDITGRGVPIMDDEDPFTVNLSNQPDGIYFLTIGAEVKPW